jgi:hypothetical protein
LERKTLQVLNSVKQIVQGIKKERGFKNESEVIAYLYALYEAQKPKITLQQHEDALKRKDEILNQLSF